MGLGDDCFSARELWDEFGGEFPGAFLTENDLVIYAESVRDNWDRKQATESLLDYWTRYPTVMFASATAFGLTRYASLWIWP